MARLRLYDVRLSRLPELIGRCQGDITQIASYVNSAQRRLLLSRENGEEGWWGTFAEVAFNLVSRANPFITCPRSIARLEALTVCKHTVPIQNQFYEYLDFGNGRMPQRCRDNWCNPQTFTRNNVPTFADITNPPKILRVYTTDTADNNANRRILIQGLDATGNVIYTQDNFNQVNGVFATFEPPFAQLPVQFSRITGIQKDKTNGEVQIFQVDPTTGVQELIHTMEPSEQVSGYRRYYLNSLPFNCCFTGSTAQTLQVTAIAKMELIPVAVDTDYLLFHNLEAIIEECCSVRYSEIDNSNAKTMAQEKHLQAIRLLQGELVHYLGKERPAVLFRPFGSARLECQKIGQLL